MFGAKHHFFSLLTGILLLHVIQLVDGANTLEHAVAVIKPETLAEHIYCVGYVPAIKDVPKKEGDAVYRPMVNLVNSSGCDYESRGLEGKVILLEHCGNDTNDETIQKLKAAKAATAIILYNPKRMRKETETKVKKMDIVVAFLPNKTGYEIAKLDEKQNGTSYAKIFTRPTSMDWSFAVIWFMAVFTVVGGSFWSGLIQYNEYQPKNKGKATRKAKPTINPVRKSSAADIHQRKPSGATVGVPPEPSDFSDSINEVDEEFSVPVSPKLVVVFVIHMSVMLLMLYYFFSYLVYVIMFLFAMASSAALVACLDPVVSRINIGTRKVPKAMAICCQAPMPIRDAVVLCMGLSVGVLWIVLRNWAYGWILQDILSIVFCINMLKGIHLPTLKLVTLLLVLLLVYDVFFVFITPLLSANRESVMIEVAKGGNSREQLPMVIKFPRLNRDRFQKCFPMKYSILGLGDILAPGLMISYCHAFDLLAMGKRFYFYVGCAGYGLGMVLTFLALHLMRNAQPALLYLVPCTIVPTVVVAWCRGQLYAIWNGVRPPGPAVSAPKPSATVNEEGGEKKDENGQETPSSHGLRKKGGSGAGSPDGSEAELLPGNDCDRDSPLKKSRRKKNERKASKDTPRLPPEGGANGWEMPVEKSISPVPSSPTGDCTLFLDPAKIRDTSALEAELAVLPSTSRRKGTGQWETSLSHGNKEALADAPSPVAL